ncbi:MAG TPA: ABC transporter permease, partial [Longimicrobiales bacterium]|nr:ABC transporter permease [Longimicrobiales bacterium]
MSHGDADCGEGDPLRRPDGSGRVPVPVRVARSWIRVVSLLVPGRHRADWASEWRGELDGRGLPTGDGAGAPWDAAWRTWGALPDALTIRREDGMMTDQWIQDLRFALRGLARQPGFAVVATLTLALGIGATTALFSVVDGVLLRPFPYRDADQLVRVVGVRRGVAGTTPVSYPNAMDLGRTAETLTGLATFDEWYPALTTADGMVPVYGATVNASFFDVLGVEPALGRTFRADEEGSGREPRLVVTHRFWRDRLRADPGALGSSVVLNGLPYTLVGVLPDTFEDPRLQGRRWGEPQVWRTPWFEVADEFRSGRSYAALARLRSGTSLEAAQAEADVVFAGLESAFPEENRDRQVRLVSLGDAVVGGARPGLLVLLGGVGMVLLIACVNVANLLLVRGTSRSTEMDV